MQTDCETMAGTLHPIVSVYPPRTLVCDKFCVTVENLPPGLSVTLHALHHSKRNKYWEAFGHYVADQTGHVNVSEDASLGGTYTGKEDMALVWSMQPVRRTTPDKGLFTSYVVTAQELLISVYNGHRSEGFMQQPPLASAVAERWDMAPGVKRIEVQEDELSGILFIPPGPGPFPGVLRFSGLMVGVVEVPCALIASQGFVVFVMNYIIPGKHYTLDFFMEALQFLQEHPQVISDRVAVTGFSLGGAIALNMACRSGANRPRCCISYHGMLQVLDETIPILIRTLFAREDRIVFDVNNAEVWRGMTHPHVGEIINVENINCPLMMIVGEDDQAFASAECADYVAKKFHEVGKDHLLTILSYPDAGHMVDVPYAKTSRSTSYFIPIIDRKALVLWGGQPKADADAQEDSWWKTLAFLKQHLCPSPQSVPNASL